MSMRATWEADFTWLEQAQAIMEDVPFLLQLAGEGARKAIEPEMLGELGYEPPPSEGPGGRKGWTSDDQWQGYFASNGFGGGIPTVRTGKLARAWATATETTERSFQMIVYNMARASRFVFGSLALSRPDRARRFQQKFHAKTGWPLAVKIVLKWMERYQERFVENVNLILRDLGTPAFRKWGFTPRLPKKGRTR